jgi:hypothetical protein
MAFSHQPYKWKSECKIRPVSRILDSPRDFISKTVEITVIKSRLYREMEYTSLHIAQRKSPVLKLTDVPFATEKKIPTVSYIANSDQRVNEHACLLLALPESLFTPPLGDIR